MVSNPPTSSYLQHFLRERPEMRQQTTEILNVEIEDGMSVLDIGAGPGVLFQLLDQQRQDCVVYGLERNPDFHAYGEMLSRVSSRNRYVPIFGDARNYTTSFLPVDVLCFLRSFHELSPLLEERIRTVELLKQFTKPEAKVIITDPFYTEEAYRNPEMYQSAIAAAQGYLQRTFGHSHSVAELPPPAKVRSLLETSLSDIRVSIFSDELTRATDIIQTYWIIGRSVSTGSVQRKTI